MDFPKETLLLTQETPLNSTHPTNDSTTVRSPSFSCRTGSDGVRRSLDCVRDLNTRHLVTYKRDTSRTFEFGTRVVGARVRCPDGRLVSEASEEGWSVGLHNRGPELSKLGVCVLRRSIIFGLKYLIFSLQVSRWTD